jgi:outer membrane protein
MKIPGRYVAAVLMAGVVMGAPIAEAYAKEAGDFKVRLRGLAMITDTSGTTDALGGSADTTNDYLPELDFTYFFTKNIAAELILATSKHGVNVKGSTAGDLNLGTVRLLPPVLTLQYHFMPDQKISPYIGAGINYTIAYGESTGASVNDVSYSDEFGYAFQAGVDYELDDK